MLSESAQRYTAGEELANSLTHGVGIVLSLCGAIALLLAARASAAPHALVSCAIYALTLVLLYTASTLYHSRAWPDAKALLQTLDHIAIFLLIAGTYTPFVLLTLHGAWGWSLFGITWALALLGVIFELTALRRFRRVQIALYIAMGWICRMSGFSHLIVPAARFRLVAGAESLTEYTFNTGAAKPRFCRVCGIKSFYVPRSHPNGIDVNVCCLDRTTIEAIEITLFDDN